MASTDVDCARVLKSAPHFQIPGLSENDSMKAVCRVVDFMGTKNGGYLSATNGKPNADAVAHAVMLIRRTAFPDFGEKFTVDGEQQIGLQHIVSADNGAAYWEAWHAGGNWYQVTGADPKTMSLLKKAFGSEGESLEPKPFMIPGVMKGMDIDRVMTRFLRNAFGPEQVSVIGSSGGCGVCGGKR